MSDMVLINYYDDEFIAIITAVFISISKKKSILKNYCWIKHEIFYLKASGYLLSEIQIQRHSRRYGKRDFKVTHYKSIK